jgi:hypothetical protein
MLTQVGESDEMSTLKLPTLHVWDTMCKAGKAVKKALTPAADQPTAAAEDEAGPEISGVFPPKEVLEGYKGQAQAIHDRVQAAQSKGEKPEITRKDLFFRNTYLASMLKYQDELTDDGEFPGMPGYDAQSAITEFIKLLEGIPNEVTKEEPVPKVIEATEAQKKTRRTR